MTQVQQDRALPFAEAVEVLALLNGKRVTVEVIDDHQSVMTADGIVQCVEYSSEAEDELLIHGDDWRFTFSSKGDELVIGDEGRFQIRFRTATAVNVWITVQNPIDVRSNGSAS